MIIKSTIAFLLMSTFVALLAPRIGAAADQQELTVSAAISLKNAFEEIGKLYEVKHTGTKVLFNFGASGDLVRQIVGGAPVDAFASAARRTWMIAAKGYICQVHEWTSSKTPLFW